MLLASSRPEQGYASVAKERDHWIMKAKILIVDDEPNLLRLMGYAVTLEGYEVVVAQSGKQALEKALSEQPDLVILDWMLPDISGLEVLNKLRRHQQTRDLPVIMLSARSEVDDKVKGLRAGADEYVTKPVDTEEMVARVEALLRRAQLQEAPAPTSCLTMAFIGAKGGVGTTTIALNTAVLLAQSGKRVVGVEFGEQVGGFATHLNVEPARTAADLEASISAEAVARCLVKQAPSLYMLYRSANANGTPSFGSAQIKAILSALQQMARYLVVDFSAWPSLCSEEVLRMTDRTLLVVEREPTSVRAAKIVLQRLQAWGISRSAVEVISVNRTPLAISLSSGEISKALGSEVVAAVPNAAEGLVAAQRRGEPLAKHQPQNPTVTALRRLAEEITGEVITSDGPDSAT